MNELRDKLIEAMDQLAFESLAACPGKDVYEQGQVWGARTAISEALDLALDSGCPCKRIAPCSAACTCANPLNSGGCRRCALYGSASQRNAVARRIALAIAEYEIREALP